MKEIEEFYLKNLSNGAHTSFHSLVISNIEPKTASLPGVEIVFAEYKAQFELEQEAYRRHRKSSYTKNLETAHLKRSDVFRGLKYAIKSYSYHSDLGKKKAARDLQAVLHKFGDVSRKGVLSASIAAGFIVSVSRKQLNAAIELLGIGEWFEALDEANLSVESLMQTRNSELAQKTKRRMAKERPVVDAAFRKLCTRINAAAIVNGEDQYASAIASMNSLIKDTKLKLAQHMGHLARKRRLKEEARLAQSETKVVES